MRLTLLVFATSLVFGCDSKPDEPIAKKTKSLSELQQDVKDERTPEELEKARKEAGFKDPEEAAKENIAAMEKGEREFVKTRIAKYKEMAKGFRENVDGLEKDAKAWAGAKDPQKAFDKWVEGYKEDVKGFFTAYNELSENGIRGGALAATISKALRTWENVNNDLGPEISKEANFEKSIGDLRTMIDEIDKELGAIEKDDTLKVNENYEDESKEDAKADGKEDAKADGKEDAKAG